MWVYLQVLRLNTNTQAEIRQAMADLKNGTFIKPAH